MIVGAGALKKGAEASDLQNANSTHQLPKHNLNFNFLKGQQNQNEGQKVIVK
jgi:hypothetical protein